MVRLFFENTNLPGPVAAVRWCVDRVDLNRLKDLKVTKPYVALIVAKKSQYLEDGPQPEDGFEVVESKIFPLDQAMESYFEFRSSGNLRVFGKLVWCRDFSDQNKNERRLAALADKYNCGRVEDVLDDLNLKNFSSSELEHGYADVSVPEGHFAKEPSAWEKWWVNLWYESKPINQCQFRKRRMLAYSLQPFVVVPYMLLRSFIILGQIIILMLAGMRKIKYSAIFHPFSYGIEDFDVLGENSTSVFFKDYYGRERNPFIPLFTPAIQIGVFLLAVLARGIFSFIFEDIGPIWFWFVSFSILFFMCVAFGTYGILDKLFPNESQEERDARRNREMERIYGQYQDIVCVGVPLKADVSALPRNRQTFYLKFQELKRKRKLCLPFSK